MKATEAELLTSEINTARHTYAPPLRTPEEIKADILVIEMEANGLMSEMIGALAQTGL